MNSLLYWCDDDVLLNFKLKLL